MIIKQNKYIQSSPRMALWTNLAVESISILPCIRVMEQASASSYLSLTPRTLAPVPPRQLGWYFLILQTLHSVQSLYSHYWPLKLLCLCHGAVLLCVHLKIFHSNKTKNKECLRQWHVRSMKCKEKEAKKHNIDKYRLSGNSFLCKVKLCKTLQGREERGWRFSIS